MSPIDRPDFVDGEVVDAPAALPPAPRDDRGRISRPDWDGGPPEPEPEPQGNLTPAEGQRILDEAQDNWANRPMAETVRNDNSEATSLERFAQLEEGEVLLNEWGDAAEQNLSMLHARLDTLLGTMTAEGQRWVEEVFEALPLETRLGFYRVLGSR